MGTSEKIPRASILQFEGMLATPEGEMPEMVGLIADARGNGDSEKSPSSFSAPLSPMPTANASGSRFYTRKSKAHLFTPESTTGVSDLSGSDGEDLRPQAFTPSSRAFEAPDATHVRAE